MLLNTKYTPNSKMDAPHPASATGNGAGNIAAKPSIFAFYFKYLHLARMKLPGRIADYCGTTEVMCNMPVVNEPAGKGSGLWRHRRGAGCGWATAWGTAANQNRRRSPAPVSGI